MSFYVYILQSEVDGSYYKGFSENPLARLEQYNRGEALYSSRKIPWKLLYVEECPTKSDSLKREKALKKYSHSQIIQLVQSSKNILDLLK